jgi:Tfp pilus assembly protein PilO
MLRTRTARWSTGTAVVCLLLLAAAWFLLVAPRRSEAADLSDQTVTGQQQNDQLRAQIDQLKAQSTQLSTYRADLAGVVQQLPADAQMPQLVRSLSTLAGASGVVVDTLTPSSASALTATATSGGAASAASAPAAASASTAKASTAKGTGVVQIPISLVVHGDFFQAIAFLQKLQTQLTRAFLVNAIQVAQSTGAGSGQVQLSLTGAVFAWPAGGQANAAATPTATATATATTGGTS